jgi:hypothetical protein
MKTPESHTKHTYASWKFLKSGTELLFAKKENGEERKN